MPKGDNRGDQSLSSRQFQTRLASRNAQVSRKSAVDSGKESFRELPGTVRLRFSTFPSFINRQCSKLRKSGKEKEKNDERDRERCSEIGNKQGE